MAKKSDPTLPYSKQLSEHREDFNQKEPFEGYTERQLAANSHKEEDASVPFNERLSKARSGSQSATTEKQMDNPKLYNDKRNENLSNKSITPMALLSESYDKEKTKAFVAARTKDRDTEFWDKYVGSQMIGEMTYIPANTQKSQLPNHPDRFDGLTKDIASSTDKFDDLMLTSLKKADSMMFQIFAKASLENRKLTAKEEQQVNDINSGKARLIAAAEGWIKSAQWDDDFAETGWPGDGSGMDDLADFNANEVNDYMNEGGQLEDGMANPDDFDVSPGKYSIVPNEQGFNLFKIEPGETQSQFVATFPNEQDAHTFAERDPSLDGFDYVPDLETQNSLDPNEGYENPIDLGVDDQDVEF